MGEEEGKRRRREERQGIFMCRKQGKAMRAHNQLASLLLLRKISPETGTLDPAS